MSTPFFLNNSEKKIESTVMKENVVFEESESFEEPLFRMDSFPSVKHEIFLGKKEKKPKKKDKEVKKTEFSHDDIIKEKIKLQKIEWMLPPTQNENNKSVTVRYDFSGEIITKKDVSKEVNQNFTSEYFHHSHHPETPGYSLEEILMYIRSKVSSSQILFLQVFTRIITVQKTKNHLFYANSIRPKFKQLNLFKLFNTILATHKNTQILSSIIDLYHSVYSIGSYEKILSLTSHLRGGWIPFVVCSLDQSEVESMREFFRLCIERRIWGTSEEKMFAIFLGYHNILCENDVVVLFDAFPIRTVSLIARIYAYNNKSVFSKDLNDCVREKVELWFKEKKDFDFRILFFFREIDISLSIECALEKLGDMGKYEDDIVVIMHYLSFFVSVDDDIDKVGNFLCDNLDKFFQQSPKLVNCILSLALRVSNRYQSKGETKPVQKIKSCLKKHSKRVKNLFFESMEQLRVMTSKDTVKQIEFTTENTQFISPQWFESNKVQLEAIYFNIALVTTILKYNQFFFNQKLFDLDYKELLSFFFKFSMKFRYICKKKLRKLTVVLLHDLGMFLRRIFPQNVDLKLLLIYTSVSPRNFDLFTGYFKEICSINQIELEKYLKEILFQNSNSLDIDWYFFVIEKKYLSKMKINSKLLLKSLKFINYVEKNCEEYLHFIPPYIRLVNIMKVFLFDCNFWEEKDIENELFEFLVNYYRRYFNEKIEFLNEKDDEIYFLEFLTNFITQFCSVSFLNEIFTYFLLIFCGNQWGKKIKSHVVETMKNKLEKYMVIKNKNIQNLFLKNNYVCDDKIKRQFLIEKIILDLFDSEENSINFKKNNGFMYNIFLQDLKSYKKDNPLNYKFIFKSLDLNNFIEKELEII